MPRSTRTPQKQRRTSDIRAQLYLGSFEIRRVENGQFGIFMRGTSTRVGTVLAKAGAFARALMTLMEVPHMPSEDVSMRQAIAAEAAESSGSTTTGAAVEGPAIKGTTQG